MNFTHHVKTVMFYPKFLITRQHILYTIMDTNYPEKVKR